MEITDDRLHSERKCDSRDDPQEHADDGNAVAQRHRPLPSFSQLLRCWSVSLGKSLERCRRWREVSPTDSYAEWIQDEIDWRHQEIECVCLLLGKVGNVEVKVVEQVDPTGEQKRWKHNG